MSVSNWVKGFWVHLSLLSFIRLYDTRSRQTLVLLSWGVMSNPDNPPILGARWLCGTVLSSRLKGCKFDPGSRQLLGEGGSALSLTLAELYGL